MSDKKKDKENKEIKELENKIAINLAGWQKALADYQNLAKDTDKRISQLKDLNKIDLVRDILPIFDNYQTALDHIPEKNKKESWAVGLEHTLKLWTAWLEDNGVETIETQGEVFDPYLHESVGQINDAKQDDQLIVEEKLKGYKLKDMVIRPAKVIINNKE